MSVKYEIHTSADPTVTRIIPELAKEIGLNESIVLLQIAYWIKSSNHEQDGEFWTFQSVRAMREKAFGYWSADTIARTVNNLIEAGYLKTRDDLNERKGDKTRWFALNPEMLRKLKSVGVVEATSKPVRKSDTLPESKTTIPQGRTDPSDIRTDTPQNRTTLPEIEITTEIKDKEQQLDPPAPEMSNVYAFYVENMRQQINDIVRNKLIDAVKEFGDQWVKDAVVEAVTHNAKTWAYVEAVLDRWGKEGKDKQRDKAAPLRGTSRRAPAPPPSREFVPTKDTSVGVQDLEWEDRHGRQNTATVSG